MAKKISAEIVADSINSNGNRITTFLLTYPRFIHGEIMTHRLFSRNSASSRAIPFEKMLKMVEEDPFIPIVWQKDHKGMQGTEYITEPQELEMVKAAWLFAKDDAVDQAIGLNKQDVTKQLCNRLLEPYMWHTVLVTSTSYENFFELRCPKYKDLFSDKTFRSWKDLQNSVKDLDVTTKALSEASIFDKFRMNSSQAEIHIQALAEAMWDVMNESTPKLLEPDQWHIPFGDNISDAKVLEYLNSDGDGSYGQQDYDEIKTKVSVARCARLSYMTFDGEIDYEKDIKLHDQLLESKHFSPFEHIAKCQKCTISNGNIEKGFTHSDMNENLWSGNFKGWIQYRQLVQ